MQNKTIDGVPREDLHELHVVLCNMEVQDGSVYADIRDRLRALLDAPVCMDCKGSGKLEQHLCPCGAGWGTKADQPQGEPAAWVNDQQLLLCSKSPREVEPENPMVHNLPRNIAGSALRTSYCNTPLYAAPVAVVLPERMPVPRGDLQPFERAEAIKWNACLDELKRLNKKE